MRKGIKIFLIVIALGLIGSYFVASKFFTKKSISQKYICKDCNVVFVGMDATQALHLHYMGYPRETSPELDKLASQGVAFMQNISPAPWTVPSFMATLTSTYPTVHKLVNRYVEFDSKAQVLSNLNKLSPNIITAAEEFKRLGYITGGFTGDAGVGAVLGYNKGFDVYTDEVRFGGLGNSAQHALSWIDANPGKKFFMFYHGYDAHGQFNNGTGYKSPFQPVNYVGPFKGTPEEQGKLRELGLANKPLNLTPQDIEFWRAWYDGKILEANNQLASFMGELDKRGLTKDTIFVIFSDHGTEFMEHGKFDHGHTLYDELLRVPLIIVAPGVTGGKQVTAQVTTLDALPTVLDLLGVQVPSDLESQMVGQSLAPYMEGKDDGGRDIFSETDYRDYTHKRSIRTTDGWKLIITMETGKEELYNLKEDPAETKNLADEFPKITYDLQQKIYKHIEDMGDNPFKKWEIGCLPAYPDQCRSGL